MADVSAMAGGMVGEGLLKGREIVSKVVVVGHRMAVSASGT